MKNVLWLFSGQIIGRGLRALLIIFAVRSLSASDWGAFSYALSLAATFTIFSDIGINALIVKEGSRDYSLIAKYITTGLFLKLGLLGFLSFILISAQNIIIQIPEALILAPFIIVIFIIDSLRDFLSALARGVGRMDIEARGQIITNVFIVFFGALFLTMRSISVFLISGYIIGAFIGLIAVFLPLRNQFHNFLKFFDVKLIKQIIITAWPFGLVSLMGVIMINTDILILGAMGSALDVGLYAAAQKPTQLLYLIPSVLAAAFFPSLSKQADIDKSVHKKEFSDLLISGISMSYFFALPLAIGGALTAEPLIVFLYGTNFLLSYSSFALLSLTFIFVFPLLFLTNALFALNNKRFFYNYLIFGVLTNVILNIILIPIMGITGCALSTLLVQIMLFIIASIKLKKEISLRILPYITKLICATIIMTLITTGLLSFGAHVVLTIFIGGIAYLLSLIALREPIMHKIISLIYKNPSITSGVEI